MSKDKKEYGYEGEMAMTQLKAIMQHSKQLHDLLEPDTDLPEWVQSKITLAYDYIQTAADYMATELDEALTGNQHKIDANKNGKIDAHDFRLIRAKDGKPPFSEPYSKTKVHKDEYGNVIKNVAKRLAKKGMAANEEALGEGILKKMERGIKGWGGDTNVASVKRDTDTLSKDSLNWAANVRKKIIPGSPAALQSKLAVRKLKNVKEEAIAEDGASAVLRASVARSKLRDMEGKNKSPKLISKLKARIKAAEPYYDKPIKEEMSPQEAHFRKHGYYNHLLKTPTKDEALKHAMNKITDAFGSKKKPTNEEAPTNAAGGGAIDGIGVGPKGEPGVKRSAMDKYKKKNAEAAPKAGRKTFSLFMRDE